MDTLNFNKEINQENSRIFEENIHEKAIIRRTIKNWQISFRGVLSFGGFFSNNLRRS